MSGRPSDHANTNLRELHLRVVRGAADGQVIWQPRIGCWYGDKMFLGQPLPAPYEGLTRAQLYRALGVSARLYEYNRCFRLVEHPKVEHSVEKDGSGRIQRAVTTPLGTQTEILQCSKHSYGRSHAKWPVVTEEDMRVAIWRAENAAYEWDPAAYDEVHAEWGDCGAPTIYMPRVNVQHLYLMDMGVEGAVYAMADWPATVRAYFRALDELHLRMIGVINASPIEIVNFGDNLHCGTCPPRVFEEHVLPAYHRRLEKLHAGGKFVHSHWDGNTKSLLPFARRTKLDGIEAITPKPQGDVTIEEIKDALGDEMFLLDGIPAIYFDPTYPLAELEDCAHRLIELFAPKLILGISDEISSNGEIERIRIVTRIVDDYNARRVGACGEPVRRGGTARPEDGSS